MPLLHHLLDFTRRDIQAVVPSSDELQRSLLNVLGDRERWVTFEQPTDGGIVLILTRNDGCRLTFQFYKRGGMATLDLLEPVETQETPSQFPKEVMDGLKSSVDKVLGSQMSSHCFPPLKRGFYPVPYLGTADSTLQEYTISRVLCDVDSPFQNIKVYETPEYGNLMLLDGVMHISESDHAYAEKMLGNGKQSFTGSTVLVLGGGDGQILRQLLEHSPKFVTVVEIDEMVVDLSRKFLREICGEVLDNLPGENHDITIGNCLQVLKDYVREGRMFDFIISELTDVNLQSVGGPSWDFIYEVLDLSMKVLSPCGWLRTLVKNCGDREAVALYEQQVKRLSCPVELSQEVVYITSYHENWVIYKIWKK